MLQLISPVLPLLAGLLALLFIMRRSQLKGWVGEMAIRLACRTLDNTIYHCIHNVTLPTANGGTTQIDHLIVSRFGIFVVETKNYRGAIYASQYDRNWTQVLGRCKHQFQNPLRQNYGHTMELTNTLGLPREAMKPIVIFIGSARIKTQNKLPDNVLTHGLLTYVKSHQEPVLAEDDVARALRIIREKRLPPGYKTHRTHVRNVRISHSRKHR